VILIAHRGDPAHAPENTIAAFRSALRRGACRVEMDVRRCADGSWIVFHDRPAPLKNKGAGPLHAPASKEPVPTVAQALAWCRAHRLSVFLDVKESSQERKLFLLLRRSGWLPKIAVLSGTPASLQRWRRLLPAGHPLFWVTGYRDRITPRRVAMAVRLNLSGLVSYRLWITPAAVRGVHGAGLKLFVWTARTAAEIRRLRRLKVDGVMSEVW
jgi:glycerophosphoryl diester phosphodiesterase